LGNSLTLLYAFTGPDCIAAGIEQQGCLPFSESATLSTFKRKKSSAILKQRALGLETGDKVKYVLSALQSVKLLLYVISVFKAELHCLERCETV